VTPPQLLLCPHSVFKKLSKQKILVFLSLWTLSEASDRKEKEDGDKRRSRQREGGKMTEG